MLLCQLLKKHHTNLASLNCGQFSARPHTREKPWSEIDLPEKENRIEVQKQ